jgi:hemerythrin-like domain-containing protein
MPHPAVDQLVREHDQMVVLLVMLDSHFAAMRAGEEGDLPLVLDAMSYLTEFVDDVHHRKVHLAVSEATRRTPAIQAAEPEIDAQHRRIRLTGGQLRADLETASLDAPVSRGTLAEEGFKYTAELRRNMEFEEQQVFPALSAALDGDGWSRIVARLGPACDPLFGAVAEERYIKLLRELTERFAGGDIR